MNTELTHRRELAHKLARMFPSPQEASIVVTQAGGNAASIVEYGGSPLAMWTVILQKGMNGAFRMSSLRDVALKHEVGPVATHFGVLLGEDA